MRLELKKNTWFWKYYFNNFKWRNEWYIGRVNKTIKNETREQKGGFLSMLLGTLGASWLGNLLTGKGILRAGSGNNKDKGILRAGSGCPLSSPSKKEWDF